MVAALFSAAAWTCDHSSLRGDEVYKKTRKVPNEVKEEKFHRMQVIITVVESYGSHSNISHDRNRRHPFETRRKNVCI